MADHDEVELYRERLPDLVEYLKGDQIRRAVESGQPIINITINEAPRPAPVPPPPDVLAKYTPYMILYLGFAIIAGIFAVILDDHPHDRDALDRHGGVHRGRRGGRPVSADHEDRGQGDGTRTHAHAWEMKRRRSALDQKKVHNRLITKALERSPFRGHFLDRVHAKSNCIDFCLRRSEGVLNI